MSELQFRNLGDVVVNLDARRVPVSSRVRAQRRGPYPYHGATGVMDYIDGFLFEGLHLLVAEDGSVATRAGKPFLQLVDGRFWVNNHAHVLRGQGDDDTRFLYYALSTVSVQPYVSGSVQAKLSQANLNRIPVRYPAPLERRAIAEVLGALDDAIEANNTLIAAAGRLGAALFHGTFERHTDNAKVRLGDIADVIDCLHSKKPSRDHSQFRYLVLPDIRDDGRLEVRPNFTISERDYIAWTRRIEVGAGDCVITNVGRVGAAAQLPKGTRAAIGRNMTAVRARANQYEAFLIEALRSKSVAREITAKTDQGTILSALNVRTIPQLNLPAGASAEYETFQKRCEPLHDLEDALLAESERLSEVRDALLPKIISGGLRIRDAEDLVEEAV